MSSRSGDWDTPANWSTGQLPGPADDVVIDQPGITVTHGNPVSDSVHSITSQDPLTLSAGALLAAAHSTFNDVFTVSGGVLFGGTLSGGLPFQTSFVVNALFRWTGGLLGGGSLLRANGGISIDLSVGGTLALDISKIDNAGNAVLSGAGVIGAAELSGWVNEPGSSLTIQGDGGFGSYDPRTGQDLSSGLGPADFTFLNAGTVVKSSGTGTSALGPVVNFGAGLTETAPPGTIHVQTGTLAVGELSNNEKGVFQVDAGATLSFTFPFEDAHFVAGSSITGAGNVVFGGGGFTLAEIAGQYAITGTTQVAGGPGAFQSFQVVFDGRANVGTLLVDVPAEQPGNVYVFLGGDTLASSLTIVSPPSGGTVAVLETGGSAHLTVSGQTFLYGPATVLDTPLTTDTLVLGGGAILASVDLRTFSVPNSFGPIPIDVKGSFTIENATNTVELDAGPLTVPALTLPPGNSIYLNGGSLVVRKDLVVQRDSLLSIDLGEVDVGHNFTLAGGTLDIGFFSVSRFEFLIGGAFPPPLLAADRLRIAGAADLDGTLVVAGLDGIDSGQVFPVITFGSLRRFFDHTYQTAPGFFSRLDDAHGVSLLVNNPLTAAASVGITDPLGPVFLVYPLEPPQVPLILPIQPFRLPDTTPPPLAGISRQNPVVSLPITIILMPAAVPQTSGTVGTLETPGTAALSSGTASGPVGPNVESLTSVSVGFSPDLSLLELTQSPSIGEGVAASLLTGAKPSARLLLRKGASVGAVPILTREEDGGNSLAAADPEKRSDHMVGMSYRRIRPRSHQQRVPPNDKPLPAPGERPPIPGQSGLLPQALRECAVTAEPETGKESLTALQGERDNGSAPEMVRDWMVAALAFALALATSAAGSAAPASIPPASSSRRDEAT